MKTLSQKTKDFVGRHKKGLVVAGIVGLITLASLKTEPQETHYSSVRKPFKDMQAHAGTDPLSPFIELENNGSQIIYRKDRDGNFISYSIGANYDLDSTIKEHDNPNSAAVAYYQTIGMRE